MSLLHEAATLPRLQLEPSCYRHVAQAHKHNLGGREAHNSWGLEQVARDAQLLPSFCPTIRDPCYPTVCACCHKQDQKKHGLALD